jgi:hypothetical protein
LRWLSTAWRCRLSKDQGGCLADSLLALSPLEPTGLTACERHEHETVPLQMALGALVSHPSIFLFHLLSGRFPSARRHRLRLCFRLEHWQPSRQRPEQRSRHCWWWDDRPFLLEFDPYRQLFFGVRREYYSGRPRRSKVG